MNDLIIVGVGEEMNDVLKTFGQIQDDGIQLCPRCQGRLFGKLGHNLTNINRGIILQWMLRLKQYLNERSNVLALQEIAGQPNNIEQLFSLFSFQSDYLSFISKVTEHLNDNFPAEVINNISNGHSKNENENRLNIGNEELINSGLLQNIYNWIMNTNIAEKIFKLDPAFGLDNTEYCELCEGLFDDLEHYTKIVYDNTKEYEFNDFLIGCKIEKDIIQSEEELWSRFGLKQFEQIKSEFNRELGKLVGQRLGIMVNFDNPEMTIIIDTRYDTLKLQIASAFFYGRYRKLVRDIPQTRWPCKQCWGKGCRKCDGTGKIYKTSVEEEIAKTVMDETKGKAHFFHGMGREDIGVRMLGSGRPFILEISEPKNRTVDLKKLRREINKYTKGKVEVSDISRSTRNAVRELKAAKPDKTYKLKVRFGTEVDNRKLNEVINRFSGVAIKQRTPERVSHRRADLVRERYVKKMDLLALTDDHLLAELKILGQSGLYIKELINGDSGRTKPSLATELEMDCVVEELDVLNIHDNEIDDIIDDIIDDKIDDKIENVDNDTIMNFRNDVKM